MKPGKALPAKSLYPLAEVAALVGCTTCDLVHYAVQRRISLLVGVPERLSVLVYEDSTRKHSAPMSLSPQMLSLSANQCLKLEMQGRIQQCDFVSGYVLESDGELKKLLPNSGQGEFDLHKFFWRLVGLGQAFRLEIHPEQLFVTRDDLLVLMGKGDEPSVSQQPVRKEKKSRASSGGNADVPDTGSGGGQVGESVDRTSGGQEKPVVAESRKAVAVEIKRSTEPVEAAPKPSPRGPVILRLKQVIERTGLSRSTIYDRMNPNSPRHDVSFPRQLSLGGDAVGWEESAIDRWVQSRIVAGRS